jgi:hypothetical protein
MRAGRREKIENPIYSQRKKENSKTQKRQKIESQKNKKKENDK